MLGNAGLVFCVASVIATMTGFDRLNVQHRNFIACPRNHDAIVCGDVKLGYRVEAVRERPPNVHGQVTLRYRTRRGYRLIEIEFFSIETEGRNYWQNCGCGTNCKTLLKKCHKITINCKIGAVSRYPGLILRVASVVAAVPCLHGFNVQHRKFIAGLRDHDAVVGRNIVLGKRLETVGQRPPDLEWQVSLADRASSRN